MLFLVNFDGQIFQHQNMRKGQTLIEVLIALENIENVVKLQLSEAQIRLRLSLFDNMGPAPIGDLYLKTSYSLSSDVNSIIKPLQSCYSVF